MVKLPLDGDKCWCRPLHNTRHEVCVSAKTM